jgi:mRNA interferase YafQ
MRNIVYTSQFKRDFKKRSTERGFDKLFAGVTGSLAAGESLDSKFRDHPLKGGYAGFRECHLKPNLLLIYVQTADELRLVRLGSHSELFD